MVRTCLELCIYIGWIEVNKKFIKDRKRHKVEVEILRGKKVFTKKKDEKKI